LQAELQTAPSVRPCVLVAHPLRNFDGSVFAASEPSQLDPLSLAHIRCHSERGTRLALGLRL